MNVRNMIFATAVALSAVSCITEEESSAPSGSRMKPGDSLPAEKMFDFDLLSKAAASSLGRIKTVLQQNGGNTVRFYLCGLKPLTVIALNEARKLDLRVECMHWNMDKESYFLQKVNL